MEYCASYESYLECLLNIAERIDKDNDMKDRTAQDERESISDAEKKYAVLAGELQNAKKAVRGQYRSVWESCTQGAGLKIPQDQKPVSTTLSWKEAVRAQERAAAELQEWFRLKSQQAVAERQNRIREEEKKQAAMAAAQAEESRKKAEEAARAEKERGEALIEEMKRKYRGR